MTEISEFENAPRIGKARSALLKRLIDVVATPGSRLSPPDRAMAGDILLDMLFHASEDDRVLCAQRLQHSREAPRRLLRYLGQCAFVIAQPLLEENEAYDATDLCHLVAETTMEHRLAIAARKTVSVSVSEALVDAGEPQVIRVLLGNKGAELAEATVDDLVFVSRNHEDLCSLLVERSEIRPTQAMAMFWWSDGVIRRTILQRHAADRMDLIDACADVFRLAAEEEWQDPVTRKTLQLIERRQRNRAALEKSDYDSLEEAIKVATYEGMSSHLAQEIGYLSGIKPVTIAKILSDRGGEGLAVLCKATGLKRNYLREFWLALKRPLEIDTGIPHPQFEYVAETYELLTVGKAQTTLRYWNWSLSSSFSPRKTTQEIMLGESSSDEAEYSTSQRTARLVFGK